MEILLSLEIPDFENFCMKGKKKKCQVLNFDTYARKKCSAGGVRVYTRLGAMLCNMATSLKLKGS